MSKNFSVEWLSQSYHARQMDQENSIPTANIFHLVGEGDCVEGEKVPSSPASKYDSHCCVNAGVTHVD